MITNDLSRDERETSISQIAEDRDCWIAWTSDPVMDRKLEQVAELLWTDGRTAKYRLEAGQVRLYPPVSDAQRERARELAEKRLK